MSVNDTNPIAPGSPLAHRLDEYTVPGLSAGFAERVMASAEARPSPLPPLRRTLGRRSWRMGQRIAIGIASFSVVATAAAATGMLERFDIPVPSASKVWASIAGTAPVAATRTPALAAAEPRANEDAAPARVEIVGPVDTPEELAEAFRRIDEVRQGRIAARRALADQRIDTAIERRRAAGLPVPTAEEEAVLRDKMAAAQARREQIVADRMAARRAELAQKVDSGEALTREDIVRPLREDAQAMQRERREQRIERLQRMAPEQRRAALRRLPPAERRALMEQYRAGRAAQAAPAPEAGPETEPTPAPTG